MIPIFYKYTFYDKAMKQLRKRAITFITYLLYAALLLSGSFCIASAASHTMPTALQIDTKRRDTM
jgi:hypothetical protein